MASSSLHYLPAPQCDGRSETGERCPEAARWFIAVRRPAHEDVVFLCEPHLLEKLSHLVTWQLAFRVEALAGLRRAAATGGH